MRRLPRGAVYAIILWVIKMNILICDDERQTVEDLKAHIREFMACHAVNFEIVATTDPKTVVDSDEVFQLAFLDIQMAALDGISLAKELEERNPKVVIFFITAYNSYQDDAMDVRAFRFFEKPVDPVRLYSGLEKAMEYIDESYVDFYLYTNNEHRKILMTDVLYVERANRKVTLFTTQGNFATRETFDEWCDILQNSFFYRVHKSFIVNLHYVTSYKYTELILQNNVRIPIAQRRQADFHKFWFSYLRKR